MQDAATIDGLLTGVIERDTVHGFDVRRLPARPGVALLADAEDAPVLLALGQNLRALVQHRLSPPSPEERTKRANLAEVTQRIRFRETFSRFESAWLHWCCAKALFPRGYRRMLAFGPSWMLRVDPQAAHPRFEAVQTFGAAGDSATAQYLGPFATRKAADGWIAALEDLFDLCRYHDILVQTPHGEACAYFEMGKCPAPCNGTIGLDDYRGMIGTAAAFAAGDRAAGTSAAEERMQRESAALRFERAAAIHRSLREATALAARPEHAHVRDVTRAAWLVVRRAGPASRRIDRVALKAFAAGPGGVRELSTVRLPQIDDAVTTWLAEAGAGVSAAMPAPAEPTIRTEAFWLISRHLCGPDANAGIIVRVDAPIDSAALTGRIREALAPAGRSDVASDPAP